MIDNTGFSVHTAPYTVVSVPDLRVMIWNQTCSMRQMADTTNQIFTVWGEDFAIAETGDPVEDRHWSMTHTRTGMAAGFGGDPQEALVNSLHRMHCAGEDRVLRTIHAQPDIADRIA